MAITVEEAVQQLAGAVDSKVTLSLHNSVDFVSPVGYVVEGPYTVSESSGAVDDGLFDAFCQSDVSSEG